MSAKPLPASVPAGKYADTKPGVHEIFRVRWSPRSFSSRAVPDEAIEEILEAGRWAASSFNEQPWRFLVAKKDTEAFQTLLSVLAPFNQAWAKNASFLVLTVARHNFSHNETPNAFAMHDTGAALAHMMLQAAASGLHAHGMAGFDKDKARAAFHIPPEFEIGAVTAFGYADSPDKLDDQMKQRELAPRTRKPLSEIAFNGRWGEPLAS